MAQLSQIAKKLGEMCYHVILFSQTEKPLDKTLKRQHGEAKLPKIAVDPLRHYTLLWQWLVGPDRDILDSINKSLGNPSKPLVILRSCDFFTNMLLNDLPAEVFVQRPAIVKQFHDLLWSSPSSRLTTASLIALAKLTQKLIARIRYYSDPNTHNLKLNNYHIKKTSLRPRTDTMDFESIEETMTLMQEQMSIPQYCLNTINTVFDYLYSPPSSAHTFQRRKCLQGINTSLALLKSSIKLLKISIKGNIWSYEAENKPNLTAIITKLNATLVKFGAVLQHYRIKVLAEDFNVESRLIQLTLLCTFVYFCRHFMPKNAGHILPSNLKHAIAESILDPSLSQLFPLTHKCLLRLVSNAKPSTASSEADALKTYHKVTRICQSMTASIHFLRKWQTLPFAKSVQMVSNALASMEFHRNTNIIQIFVKLCAANAPDIYFQGETMQSIENILLILLSHIETEIKHKTYFICHRIIIQTIGAKYNKSRSSAPGSQVLFLFRQNILTEIACFGIHDRNEEIQRLSEDILVHILKCKVLVSEDVWCHAIKALMPTLPILLTQINNPSSLIGRNILSLLDPDRSAAVNLTRVDLLRLNAGLLFGLNPEAHIEAVSRLCWLLSTNPGPEGDKINRSPFLPHLNNLHDKSLTVICSLVHPIDYKTIKIPETHFYQASSLQQVLDLLSSSSIEPVIRRSAITQIAAMMEDPILHSIFLDNKGLKLVKETMRSALIEGDYSNYPDSIIPCLSILKNLALYNSSTRFDLAQSEEFLMFIIRSVFLFCTEERVKNNGSILLFLLVFCDYIRGSPLSNDLCIVHLLQTKLKCPFDCNTYWKCSQYEVASLQDLKENQWALKSIQIHWNVEWFNGLEQLLCPNLLYDQEDNFSENLKLTSNDLHAVKSTSLIYLIKKYLKLIHDTHKFSEAMEVVQKLTMCLNLYDLVKSSMAINLAADYFEWEKSLSKYFSAPPAGGQDMTLLSHLIDFLSLLLPHIKHSSPATWLIGLLNSKTIYFNEVLATEVVKHQDIEAEMLHNSLLALINKASSQNELAFNNCKVTEDTKKDSSKSMSNFSHFVQIILEKLHSESDNHLSNVAYLDRLMTTLVNLTSSVGWSDSKPGESMKQPLRQSCFAMFEVLNSIHCDKGSVAEDCFMGLSVTRNIMLFFNHLIAEMQHFHVKQWEECFMGNEITHESTVQSICRLAENRDVGLRAAAINVLVGLATSEEAAIAMIQDSCIYESYINIWKVALKVLCDQAEASLFRENAALLLTNLSSHFVSLPDDNVRLAQGILPVKLKKIGKCTYEEISLESERSILTALLDACNFYIEAEALLKRLFTAKVYNFYKYRTKLQSAAQIAEDNEFIFVYNTSLQLSNVSDSLNTSHHPDEKLSEYNYSIATSRLVKSLALFVNNLVSLLSRSFSGKLQELGLIKLFFRCVTLPKRHIKDTRDILCYSELLQMNTAIFTLLSNTAIANQNCLLTIGNLSDCLDITTALLNPDLFFVPQFAHLRNDLWASIYNLLEILLHEMPVEALTGITKSVVTDEPSKENKHEDDALIKQVEYRKEPFFRALYESINSKAPNDLQLSALSSLSSLLQTNARTSKKLPSADFSDNKEDPDSSIQTLLDCTKTRRSPPCPQTNRHSRNVTVSTALCKTGLVNEDVKNKQNASEESDALMAGAELCKIVIEIYNSQTLSQSTKTRKRPIVLSTLTALLLISNEAKEFALGHGLLPTLIEQLRQIYFTLSLENVDALRKITEKKRLTPTLTELEGILGILSSFFYNNKRIKEAATNYDLTDLIHKLWEWLNSEKDLLVAALKMLCIFTTNCSKACATLASTSNLAGYGPRKTLSGNSLLHAICNFIQKEMEQLSRTHSLDAFQLAFRVLRNAANTADCRLVFSKNNFLAAFAKLHPQITKHQKQWEQAELNWLQFLNALSAHPEGQILIGKMQDVCDIVIALCSSPQSCNRIEALETMRNIAFHPGNKPRLLALDEFMNLLATKLTSNVIAEANIVVLILWTMAANSQKTKLIFKCAQFDAKMQDFLRTMQQTNYNHISQEELERLHYVISILNTE